MNIRNPYWLLDTLSIQKNDDWLKSYCAMEPQDKWVIDHTLNALTWYSKPWNKFPVTKCAECDECLYLLNIGNDGLGHKTIQFTVKK